MTLIHWSSLGAIIMGCRNRHFHLFLNTVLIVLCCVCVAGAQSEPSRPNKPRERTRIDSGWLFSLGHAGDPKKDFDPANNLFSYFAKTGAATGAAAVDFDDSAWRKLDLPHDWAVELPFDERGSNSHGSKAIGRNFLENSVGWYRKRFAIPASDLGRKISIEFDGIFRDSAVWINGHYLGREESGYSSFACNLTEYLNYGGDNLIAVRVDASREEGWFYEGAGIYRHVWLVKTDPIHVDRYGTFVASDVSGAAANVNVRTTVLNENADAAKIVVVHDVFDSENRHVASAQGETGSLEGGDRREFSSAIALLKTNR